MSELPYRSLRIGLRIVSILIAVGGRSVDLCRQAAYRASLAATTRGRVFDPTPVPSEGDGRCHAYAESASMVYRAQPSAECGDPGRVDCRALHSLRDTPPLTLDDGHPQYLSGVPYLGTICGAARGSSFALLAETTGGALGICGAFLNNTGALGRGFCVVGSRISRERWVSDFAWSGRLVLA
jgi:hypothetical protein